MDDSKTTVTAIPESPKSACVIKGFNKSTKFEIPSVSSTPASPGEKKTVDNFSLFLKLFDDNNDGRIDLDELVNISRYMNQKEKSIYMYKRLIISLIFIFLFVALTNMGLTATAVYLYKDMYVDSDVQGRKTMVSRANKQVIEVHSADSTVDQDVLLSLESQQVLSTSNFLDERQLDVQLSDEEALSITSAQFHLADGSEYGCQVVGMRRQFNPDNTSVRAVYLSTPSGVEIEIGTDGGVIARGAEGVVQWQLPQEANSSSNIGGGSARRLQQQGTSSSNSIAFISSAYRNANQRSEDSVTGLQVNPESEFTRSVQQLRADHAAQVRQYKETTTGMIQARNAEIDELTLQLDGLNKLLGR